MLEVSWKLLSLEKLLLEVGQRLLVAVRLGVLVEEEMMLDGLLSDGSYG